MRTFCQFVVTTGENVNLQKNKCLLSIERCALYNGNLFQSNEVTDTEIYVILKFRNIVEERALQHEREREIYRNKK